MHKRCRIASGSGPGAAAPSAPPAAAVFTIHDKHHIYDPGKSELTAMPDTLPE